VSLRVYATANKLAFNVCVPIILDLIICSSRQSSSYQRPFISKQAVKFNNDLIFFFSEIASLEVRPQIVYPPQSATLATPKQTCSFGEGTPAALTMSTDVIDKALVFFLSPSAFVGVGFFTARRPPHGFKPLTFFRKNVYSNIK
jgi:hypothetical protein